MRDRVRVRVRVRVGPSESMRALCCSPSHHATTILPRYRAATARRLLRSGALSWPRLTKPSSIGRPVAAYLDARGLQAGCVGLRPECTGVRLACTGVRPGCTGLQAGSRRTLQSCRPSARRAVVAPRAPPTRLGRDCSHRARPGCTRLRSARPRRPPAPPRSEARGTTWGVNAAESATLAGPHSGTAAFRLGLWAAQRLVPSAQRGCLESQPQKAGA